jgi:hypothetical protein
MRTTKYTRKQRGGNQSGGDEFLKKAQHIHLKLTMRRLGPFFYDVNTIWVMHNMKAKPKAYIESPDQILDYVRQKTLSPENRTWSLVDNQLIKYSIADVIPQSGYKQKDLFTHRN